MKASKSLSKRRTPVNSWHPSRHWDCCMSEDEKKRDRKIMEITDSFFKNYLIQKSQEMIRKTYK